MNSKVPQILYNEFKIHNYSDLLVVWHGLSHCFNIVTYKLIHVTAATV